MLSKRSAIVLLVGLNLLLLVAVLAQSIALPRAAAQPGAGNSDLVSVTAKSRGQTYDVLYVLDVPQQKLHAIYRTPLPRNRLVAAPPRDLTRDFAGD